VFIPNLREASGLDPEVVHSILVSILLSSLALYTDNVSLMLKICFIYALTAVPFLFWLGQAVDDGKIDPQEFKYPLKE
jgi:hypothetical protein